MLEVRFGHVLLFHIQTGIRLDQALIDFCNFCLSSGSVLDRMLRNVLDDGRKDFGVILFQRRQGRRVKAFQFLNRHIIIK